MIVTNHQGEKRGTQKHERHFIERLLIKSNQAESPKVLSEILPHPIAIDNYKWFIPWNEIFTPPPDDNIFPHHGKRGKETQRNERANFSHHSHRF